MAIPKGLIGMAQTYDDKKRIEADRNAAASREGRDISDKIGSDPEDLARRDSCELDLERFLLTYFPHKFYAEFSEDHHKVINRIETSILHGGNAAQAMPRGGGKTSIVECAAIWAIVYGHHLFTVVVGSEAGAAEDVLATIKIEIDTNDMMLADFPLEVGPLRMLEGIAARANGQLCGGKRTRVKFTDKEVRFGHVEGSACSGALIRVRGITGRLRGMKFGSLRPTLILLDDPQTDDSARSEPQTRQRLKIIRKAIMGLAGPGQATTVIVPCTIIEKNDVADQLLDREQSPEFHGIRTQMVYKWPDDDDLWDQYMAFRLQDLADGNDQLPKATGFYAENRKKMDKGSEVAWAERREPWELSALQHAYNLQEKVGEDAFLAEYQNAPRSADDNPDNLSMPREIQCIKTSRSLVPAKYTKITVGVDIQKRLAPYHVIAATDAFDVVTIEYGTYPDQGRDWTRRSARVTFDSQHPNQGHEAALLKSLVAMFTGLLEREWAYEGGGTMQADLIMVDSGYEPKIVKEAIRMSGGGSRIRASKGVGIRAQDAPMSEWARKPGDRVGDNWRIPVGSGIIARTVLVDTNYWKTFLCNRVATDYPTVGSFAVYGKSTDHALFFAHMAAEYGVKCTAKGRTLFEWTERPGAGDNDYLDCAVLALVAASVTGSKFIRKAKAKAKPKAKPTPKNGGSNWVNSWRS